MPDESLTPESLGRLQDAFERALELASREREAFLATLDATTTLTTVAHQLESAPDPGAALLEFLTVAADQRQQHDLTFLQSVSDHHPTVTALRDELHTRLGTLVHRARAAGAIRDDITETDVFLMMCAPVHIVENLSTPKPLLWQRYLAIIFDGLRPQGAHPLPQPAPQLS